MCLEYNFFETTVGKREIFVTSNFSLSHSVFYPFGEPSGIFIKVKIVVCKLFQFGKVLNLSFGKGLSQPLGSFTLSQTTFFRLFRIQSLQTTISGLMKIAKKYPTGRKHGGKRRKTECNHFSFIIMISHTII